METPWRISPWIGATIGVVAAGALTWLAREGWQAFVSSGQQGFDFAGPGWLLLGLGVILLAVVFGSEFHPLISAVPAVWFLLLFGFTLLGMEVIPDWYPEWMTSYVLVTMSPAVFVVIGVLVGATITAYVRRSLFASEPVAAEMEETRV